VSNFLHDIEEALGDEAVESIVIGGTYWLNQEDDERFIPEDKRGVLLSWEEARPLLDYAYDDGYGGEDCHPIYLWTATRVLFIGCYDGSTWVTWVPRHPEAGEPGTVGGG